MDLQLFGTLPRVFTQPDLTWMRQFLADYGDKRPDHATRLHISDRHAHWKTINTFLKDKFASVFDDSYRFCYVVANDSDYHVDVLHTDMCLRLSSLPANNNGIPYQEEDQEHYTIFVCEEVIHDYGNHKPLTYIFEQSVPGFIDAPGYLTEDEIDPNLPSYEMDYQARRDLEQLPYNLISKFKVIGKVEQEPLGINYWRSINYHINDAFNNRGVRSKKFFNIMIRKIK